MCLRMSRCCLCLDTKKGTVLTAVACIAAAVFTFIFIVLGLVYWDLLEQRIHRSYEKIGLDPELIETCIAILYYCNIFTLIVIALYVFLSVLLIVGAQREEFKHMIPWISATFLLLPFVTFSFIIQLIMGLVGGEWPVIIPAIVVLVWCCFWWYGFFCAVSHYRMLKGDIHRPVATIFKRRREEDDY